MDAYAPGEIAAISDSCTRRVAIITAVGPQHMERFGTLDRIAGALYEVATALPADGTLILYTGDEPGAALAQRAHSEQRRLIRYGLEEDDELDADVVASSIRMDSRGGDFRWRWDAERLDREVSIPLLGRHQVANVSAALAAVPPSVLHRRRDRRRRLLEPVEHRLQLMASAGPLTVIDNSYNANPVGVHDGLEVLAAMPGAHKFLITPGLVELGSVEDEENRRYGAHAAKVCDHVIVMSAKTSAALCAGLRDGGMSEDRIHVVETLDAATRLLQSLSRPGRRRPLRRRSSGYLSPGGARSSRVGRSRRLRLGDHRRRSRAAATSQHTSQPAHMQRLPPHRARLVSTEVLDERSRHVALVRAQAALIADSSRPVRRLVLSPGAEAHLVASQAPPRAPRNRRHRPPPPGGAPPGGEGGRRGRAHRAGRPAGAGPDAARVPGAPVTVVGTHLLTTGAVVAAAEMPEQSIFAINGAAIQGRVQALPWVASAVVTTQLPATVEISVVERAPMLRIRRGGTDTLIASTGQRCPGSTRRRPPAAASRY